MCECGEDRQPPPLASPPLAHTFACVLKCRRPATCRLAGSALDGRRGGRRKAQIRACLGFGEDNSQTSRLFAHYIMCHCALCSSTLSSLKPRPAHASPPLGSGPMLRVCTLGRVQTRRAWPPQPQPRAVQRSRLLCWTAPAGAVERRTWSPRWLCPTRAIRHDNGMPCT